ncbi:PLC-like phosphodiesterase [Myxozyma melibiosi]|uniref:Phosphoinositide phospholipase C n=1 Tax=Myxozyma melibiosi TaxID=54550 RepID=A0ABR1F0S0_9ASCO
MFETQPLRSPSPHTSTDHQIPGRALYEETMDEPRPTPSVSSLRSPGSPSIMRRLSRGAMEKFQSRRKSSTASTGPVTRRSSSSSAQPPDDDDQPSDAPPEVPSSLANGVPFLRITRRKRIQYMFSIDAEKGTLSWDSKTKKGEISIDSIKEIRVADDARNYREEFKISAEHENLWVTILYTTEKKLKGLHIIALSKDSFDQFVSTLRRLLKYRQDVMSSLSIPGEQFVHVHWPTYITKEEGEERLSYEGVEKLARRLHVNCSKTYLRQKFTEADVDRSGFLDFEEFRNFVKMLKHRAEIVQIFKRVREVTAPREEVAVEDETLSLEMFKGFIKTVQRQSIDESLALKIYYKFVDEYQRFTVDSFTDYLLSSYNAVHKPVEGELSRPLNEYYISSSHNTYLLGRQVVGDSSVEAYIRVLQRGCRCVELDCWDGVDGPVISHGRTFTSEISFADVISAIHKFGFISSPYPLILSLEIHCSAENQMKMTEIMKSTFGDKLVTSPAALKLLSLPSPEELKHKVLIKVKASDEENRDMLGNETFTATNGTSESTETSQSEDNSGTEATGGNGIIPRRRKPKSSGTSKIAKSLGDLGVYVRGVKYRNFSLPESRTLTHCFSFGERSFNSICKDEESLSQLENHNKRYLMRVYPSGFRLTSSNYEPIVCWKRGVQMAALNWQTYDIGLQMNDAMFSVGDRSGYVLKPEMLRTVKGHHEAATKLHRRKFLLDVISAQQLPRPKDLKPDDAFDPSVEVELFTADGPVQRMRTRVVRNNGFNPIWNERMSVDVSGPLFELAFVRFQVYSTDGSVFAVFCGRLVNLQHGYRHVPLFDMQGEQFLFSTLFVRISVRDE